MDTPERPKSDQARLSGGFFIGAGAVVGAIGGGMVNGLPVQGFLIGTVAGIAIAVLIWLVDRRRP